MSTKYARHSSETTTVATLCNNLLCKAIYCITDPTFIKIGPQGHTHNRMLTTCFNQYWSLYFWPCSHWSNYFSLIKVLVMTNKREHTVVSNDLSYTLLYVPLSLLCFNSIIVGLGTCTVCVSVWGCEPSCAIFKLYVMSFIRQWEVTVKVTKVRAYSLVKSFMRKAEQSCISPSQSLQ